MNLNEYIRDVFIPIIKAYNKIGKADKAEYAKYFRNQIAKHACYIIDPLYGYNKCYVSKAAQKEYNNKYPGKLLDEEHVDDKKYHYEHIFTNQMLLDKINDQISINRIRNIISRNYCTAYILQSERRKLDHEHKSHRGNTLKDALKICRKMGIILVDYYNKSIN